MKDIKWKEFIYQQVVSYCNEIGMRTFALKDFYSSKEDVLRGFRPGNLNVKAKVRQQLQFLRDDGLLTFVDNSGNYTLRGIDLLDTGKQETQTIDLSKEKPERREYLIETYVRNVGWALKARKVFGEYCIYRDCQNTFIKEDGSPYIEVHHIIPLFQGGEDGIWNLSVLCSHHHRMAHYAKSQQRLKMQKELLMINHQKITNSL